MNFLDKLDQLMEDSGLNKNTLSQSSGIPYTTIDGWYKKGYNNAKLSSIQKIADYFHTTLDYLIRDDIADKSYGKTSTFDINFEEKIIIKKYRELDTHGKEIIQLILDHELERCESTFEKRMGSVVKENKSLYAKVIPLSGKVSAGQGVEAVEEYDTITGPDKADFALIVDGDSMEPRFHDSQIIYIRSQPQLENGQIGVVQVMVEEDFIPRVYLKKIKKHGNQVELISLNPAYEPMLFSSNEVHILGSVLN